MLQNKLLMKLEDKLQVNPFNRLDFSAFRVYQCHYSVLNFGSIQVLYLTVSSFIAPATRPKRSL